MVDIVKLRKKKTTFDTAVPTISFLLLMGGDCYVSCVEFYSKTCQESSASFK